MLEQGQVNLVAAVGIGGTIGPADGLPMMTDKAEATEFEEWFMDLTRGGIIVLGHNSLHWLRHRGFFGLPNDWQLVCWSPRYGTDPDTFMAALEERDRPIFICGGLNTYETFMPYVKQFFIRRVTMHPPFDNYLPPLFGRPQ
jgi:dihydrofolate reductase